MIDLTTVGLALSNSKAAIRGSMQSKTIGLRDKFLMKTRDCVKTPLMAAFGAARIDRRKPRGKPIHNALAQFD